MPLGDDLRLVQLDHFERAAHIVRFYPPVVLYFSCSDFYLCVVVAVLDMNMYWQMFVRVEIKSQSKRFKIVGIVIRFIYCKYKSKNLDPQIKA